MLMNLRNALMVGGGWKNPYVTDGLVAMWDGEWNVRGGEHDPNATTWKDLAGGEGDMAIPSNLKVGADSLYTESRQSITMRRLLTPAMVSAINGGNITVEFVGKCRCTENYTDTIASVCSTSSVRPLTVYAVNADSGRGRHIRSSVRATSGTAVGPSAYAWYQGDHRHSVSCVWSGSTLTQYIDGLSQGTFTNAQSSSADATTSMYLELFRVATNTYGFNGEACAFRFYSRALTAQEIAANYAIDVARFNLPTA